MSAANRLYFGDCLEVMRENIASESVDLIYLDPPFNSKRLYNAFIGGAQWVAFDDTWRWYEAVEDFHDVAGQPAYAGLMEGLRSILGESPELAYLSYMANRLLECHRVLKPTGSIYLHCDPTMSHYLKAVMDGVFGRGHFQNEIVWCYNVGGKSSKRWARKHDVILFFSKTKEFHFDGNAAGIPRDTGTKSFGGKIGKDDKGRPYQDKIARQTGKVYRYYLDSPKIPEDWWVGINSLQSGAKERLGYPTQKPVALLDRIIKASSNEGDTVLDPFCGCGTAIHAAQNLNRQWIGIDICVNACKVIEERIKGHFDSLWSEVEFHGLPKTRDDARFMATSNPFLFERWAVSLVDGMEPNKKQRGDGGIDGRGRIPIRRGQFIDLVAQAKGGSANPGHVQAFNGARQQAGADLGIFTCFEDRVTTGMRNAAVGAGLFMETPVVQIYTVEDYFEGRKPKLPVAA